MADEFQLRQTLVLDQAGASSKLWQLWQQWLSWPPVLARRPDPFEPETVYARVWQWTYTPRADELFDPIGEAWAYELAKQDLSERPQRCEVVELFADAPSGGRHGADFVAGLLTLTIYGDSLYFERETGTPANFFMYPPRLRAFEALRTSVFEK